METGAGMEHVATALDGPHSVVTLHGVKVSDYREGDPVPPASSVSSASGPRPEFGYFGLQNHGDRDVVFFKEVVTKPLKK
jgi:hypothetical protein